VTRCPFSSVVMTLTKASISSQLLCESGSRMMKNFFQKKVSKLYRFLNSYCRFSMSVFRLYDITYCSVSIIDVRVDTVKAITSEIIKIVVIPPKMVE